MIQAIIFDVDGTLAETEEVHRAAFNAAFAEFGVDWSWDKTTYSSLLTVAGGKERIMAHARELGLPTLAVSNVKAIHKRKNKLYAESVRRGYVVPRRGVLKFVEQARRQSLRLAIATTTSRENFNALLNAAFAHWPMDMFSSVVCGEDVKHKKPDPEAYISCLKELNLGPADAVAIEDSEVGLRSAIRAGLPTVVTPSFYTKHQSFGEAAAVLPDLSIDLQQFLQGLSMAENRHS